MWALQIYWGPVEESPGVSRCRVRYSWRISSPFSSSCERNNNRLTNSLVDYIRLNFMGLQCFKHIMGDM